MSSYAYVRVSSDAQTNENQKYRLLQYANERGLIIEHWVEETISSRKALAERELSSLLPQLHTGDVLLVSELSRLGRSLLEIMSILHTLMERGVVVHAVKEQSILGDNIQSKVLAFAFGLAAEIERDLISQRTKDALAYKKSQGVQLGRPKGRRSSVTKLTGKEAELNRLLDAGVSHAAIGRLYKVHQTTVGRYAEARKK